MARLCCRCRCAAATLTALDALGLQVNIVDTPGTNVILDRQQRLTEEFVPRADLVLFCLSAGVPVCLGGKGTGPDLSQVLVCLSAGVLVCLGENQGP